MVIIFIMYRNIKQWCCVLHLELTQYCGQLYINFKKQNQNKVVVEKKCITQWVFLYLQNCATIIRKS